MNFHISRVLAKDWWMSYRPIQDERLLDRSMIARLLGLLSSERFASEMSAVTRVIVILYRQQSHTQISM